MTSYLTGLKAFLYMVSGPHVLPGGLGLFTRRKRCNGRAWGEACHCQNQGGLRSRGSSPKNWELLIRYERYAWRRVRSEKEAGGSERDQRDSLGTTKRGQKNTKTLNIKKDSDKKKGMKNEWWWWWRWPLASSLLTSFSRGKAKGKQIILSEHW